ncbi:MAG: IclR family transcriptional regulator [Gammaproteobacteria bacterium]|nr:IclR family transcriptional regulator [Gammaproteobacteria bacterium]
MPLPAIPKKRRGRPRNPAPESGLGTVLALERGLVVLQALAREGYLSLTDLSLKIGVPTSTVHRILTTLEKLGFTEINEDTNEWSVGIESFRVGNSYLERTNLIESSRKVMRDLMEATGETANLAIVDGGDVVFISQVESHNPIRAFFRPGTRGYMHASGIGKALLANMLRRDVEKILQNKGCPEFTAKTLTTPAGLFEDLARTRERGWAFDDEERYDGMRCIASCIFNSYGEVVAGISVSGPTVRFPDPMVQIIGPQVAQAAQQVTALIGGKQRGYE